jgi:demethylmenaquinone methyltransferase/2-methoxy-6-polyprenyl-1,4-benzoquinol methylase/phosphoethanolamine N-methyltransferase
MQHSHAKHDPHTTGKIIRWAKWYDLLFARKPTKEHRAAVKAATLQPGEKVLDVGSGTGTMAILMAKKVGAEGEVIGIDASPDMIDVSRKKAAKQGSAARFEAAAIESLPFPDATFDVATSTLMLHHLPDEAQRKGLAEVRRVLRTGGRFVIVDFSSESQSFLGHLLSVLGHAHGGSTYPKLEGMLREAGFTNVEGLPVRRKGMMLVKAS